MEFLASILIWLFVKTIYGIAAIAAAAYVALRTLRKTFPKLPEPAFIAVPVFLIALLTVPSLPRYQFERDTMAKIQGKDWIRVVNKTKWGSLTEPLTWLRAPIGSVTLIMPNTPIEGGFRQVTIRYEEEDQVLMAEPDCIALKIIYATPDKQGVFPYTSTARTKMSDLEKSWYCEHDWSREREAFRKEALRQMNGPSK